MMILSKLRRGSMVAGCTAVLSLGGLASATPASAATPAQAAPYVAAKAYSCSPGNFCIYSGWNGTEARCELSQPRV
ncbi:MAG: peptidase inhibitor family I36 protein, partial [Actinobacteria bacterium]|nr:peptidase inhibitor family I36 protein [Actinomycetota bacterium]